MKIKQIEHYDDFDDCIIFWLEVEGVNNKHKELAKEIDKENYMDECFGVCIQYDIDDKNNKYWTYVPLKKYEKENRRIK